MSYTIMDKAKTQLVIHHPFFAAVLMSLPLKAEPSIPTAATNGVEILYNPDFIESLTIPQAMFVLAHEVMHVTMLHPWRRESREPEKWNIAIDHATNLILEEAGFESFDWVYHDKQYKEMPSEQIYNLLPDNPQQGQGQGKLVDDHMDAPGDEAEKAQSEARAQTIITQAAKVAQMAGNLPNSLKKLIDEVLMPRVNWREELRRYMTQVLKTDQSWQRGQRRFLARGLYLPTLYAEGMGELVVGVDTSGSVWDQLPEFLAEVSAIASECKPEKIHVVYCDSKINRHDEFEAGDMIVPEMCGGGGTDMREIFDYIQVKGINPQVVVVCTDLETPFPDEPDYPVIWAAVGREAAPWGDVIRLGGEL